jgi:hypothetical protein
MGTARIYLGKAGRIFGPYTDRDLAEMKATGELERFSWIWQSSAPGWQPVDPMPPAVTDGQAIEAPLPPQRMEPPRAVAAQDFAPAPSRDFGPAPVAVAPPPRPSVKVISDPIDAVCHDYRSAVAGRIVRVLDGGCELLAPDDGHATPQFREQAKLYLNLLNSKNGKTIDVVAQLAGVSHTREGWSYRLSWREVPDLLRAG